MQISLMNFNMSVKKFNEHNKICMGLYGNENGEGTENQNFQQIVAIDQQIFRMTLPSENG